MACCCPSHKHKSSSSCLGRCVLTKHRCLSKEDVKPGPVPKHMGWQYCAKTSPRFQQKCGWQPGHISCSVLRRIEAKNGSQANGVICPSRCSIRPSCSRICSRTCPNKTCKTCVKRCSAPTCFGPSSPPETPVIRIIRHGGQLKICTKPSKLNNAPSGPFPLKYVLNTDGDRSLTAKFSIEARFNDCQYDYTSSQSSFIIDFSPPVSPCARPCPKKSILCMHGRCDNSWPPTATNRTPETQSKPPETQSKPPDSQSKPPLNQSKLPKSQSTPTQTQSKPTQTQSKPPLNQSKPQQNQSISPRNQSKPTQNQSKSAETQTNPPKKQSSSCKKLPYTDVRSLWVRQNRLRDQLRLNFPQYIRSVAS